MPMATIHKMGAGSDLYHIHFLTAGEGHPDQGLPGDGRPPRPDQGLPGHGRPGIPDHDLPDQRPPTLLPGWTLVMVRDARGHWHYASVAPGSPVQPLPEPLPPGGKPDQGLPPSQPTPTPTGAGQY